MSKIKISMTTWWQVWILVVLTLPGQAIGQETVLDNFEQTTGWTFVKSDGVNLTALTDKGLKDRAIQFTYDFLKGSGYGGIQKSFPIDLPENFEFTFFLKANSPANNFEIKFIDSTGNNVWWVNNRNFDFPNEWKKIRIKKRHISFAWGPLEDKALRRISRIEFTVASFVGGKGTLWIDDLRFQPLPPEALTYPEPVVVAESSAFNHPSDYLVDGSDTTFWQSQSNSPQNIIIDFKTNREFGGLQINWIPDHYAVNYEIDQSEDGKNWENVYRVPTNQTSQSFISLPESETRYVKIRLLKGQGTKAFSINEIRFLSVQNSLTPNDFLIFCSKNSTRGNYPRYFGEEASYWTVTGVNNDVKEALINQDAMVEADKARFSIEPLIVLQDSIYTWDNAGSTQSLGDSNARNEFSFVPTVTWNTGPIRFATAVTTTGKANENSRINIEYRFENLSPALKKFEFYLLIRPYQVNPYYQFLNQQGGAGKIHSIKPVENAIDIDGKLIVPQRQPDDFGVVSFDDGNIVEIIRSNQFPAQHHIDDSTGRASGILKYLIQLNPAEKISFQVVVPFYDQKLSGPPTWDSELFGGREEASEFWKQKVGHIRFNLPPSADRILDAYRANLAYILVNRDHVGIQPGSRSYERSWIRDGALTSSALLKSGIIQEVRDFTDWYSGYQYESGKVPCVVDVRGPDPVPEHDSHGQLIYLIREYFNFTRDTAFLRSRNGNVLNAVEYIESLVAERSTDHFRLGNDSVRAYYGLVPESISHEGYSAKPMHSYWDNFFILKGLKDAAEIQRILGRMEDYKRIDRIRSVFQHNLYQSLDLAMKTRSIDYLPGCVELGDFDATSTTIALSPCNELVNLPKPQVYNTFEKYYRFFLDRKDGKIDWLNYTPYENRLIGSFILLDQPERAHELIEYFLDDQRPAGWHHWAEVVWNDPSAPRFIGDMPHTWVGSDFINSVRSMFVYENELKQTLVIASALYQDWIDWPEGMSVENLPTYYGELSYAIRKEAGSYRIRIDGDVSLPANGLKIRNFNQSRMPSKVFMNGVETRDFSKDEISVPVVPAEVIIQY